MKTTLTPEGTALVMDRLAQANAQIANAPSVDSRDRLGAGGFARNHDRDRSINCQRERSVEPATFGRSGPGPLCRYGNRPGEEEDGHAAASRPGA